MQITHLKQMWIRIRGPKKMRIRLDSVPNLTLKLENIENIPRSILKMTSTAIKYCMSNTSLTGILGHSMYVVSHECTVHI